MSYFSVNLLRFFVLFCVFCAVVECELNKRDVHHRIIITERRPRSHKRGHRHSSYSHKKHHHHKHSEESKKKKKPHHHHSFEDSYERDEGSYGSYKHHKHNTKNSQLFKPAKYASEESSKSDQFPDNTNDHWTPLLLDQSHRESFEQFPRFKPTKPTKQSKKKHQKRHPINIDITTSFPQSIPFSSFQTSNFAGFGQKFVEPNQAPLIGTIESFQKKNHNINNKQLNLEDNPKAQSSIKYEVREAGAEEAVLKNELSIKSLLPLFNDAQTKLPEEDFTGNSTRVEGTRPNATSGTNTKTSRLRLRGRHKYLQ